jgi:hypothetical protein
MFLAHSVVAMIPLTRPPIPARQNILPAPSAVSCRAARSEICPTSAAPEQAKISFGASPHEQAQELFSAIITLL